MATAYRYTGTDARDYPTLGFRVVPDDVVYLDGKAPDPAFVPIEAGSMQTGDDTPDVGVDWRASAHPSSLPLPKQPNKAASQADWVEYAKADGGFEEATGTSPDDATRRAIVEHYSFGPDPEQQTEPAAVQPAVDDTPKEV